MNILEIARPPYDKWQKVENILTTHCNQFVSDVMLSQNYHSFEGRVANTIFDTMIFEKQNWRVIDPKDWKGETIVVAAQKGKIHGHCCILLPGEYVPSGKWQKKVPLCANIGNDNFWNKGVNYAFGNLEPSYFEFIKSQPA